MNDEKFMNKEEVRNCQVEDQQVLSVLFQEVWLSG
jgi:hypothetical protein